MIIFNIKRIVKQRSSVIFSGDYINSNHRLVLIYLCILSLSFDTGGIFIAKYNLEYTIRSENGYL